MIIWFHKPKRWCFICCLVTICRLVSECTFNSPITRKKIGFSGAIFLENWHRLSKPMFNLIRILRRIGSSIYKKVILLRYKVGLIHFKCLNMALAQCMRFGCISLQNEAMPSVERRGAISHSLFTQHCYSFKSISCRCLLLFWQVCENTSVGASSSGKIFPHYTSWFISLHLITMCVYLF